MAGAFFDQGDIAKIEKHQPVFELRVKSPGIHRDTAGESAGELEVRPFIEENRRASIAVEDV